MPINPEAAHAMAAAYAMAWSSRSADAVAAFFAENGTITINAGGPMVGRAAISQMAAGFYAEFPDLVVRLDDFRISGNHAVFPWTLEGVHSETGKHVILPGWEEWTLTDDLEITESLGWFDAREYDRQVANGV